MGNSVEDKAIMKRLISTKPAVMLEKVFPEKETEKGTIPPHFLKETYTTLNMFICRNSSSPTPKGATSTPRTTNKDKKGHAQSRTIEERGYLDLQILLIKLYSAVENLTPISCLQIACRGPLASEKAGLTKPSSLCLSLENSSVKNPQNIVKR